MMERLVKINVQEYAAFGTGYSVSWAYMSGSPYGYPGSGIRTKALGCKPGL
jgi:hypothetical protein